MSMYRFGMNATNDLIDNIDSNELIEMLLKYYTIDREQLEMKIKKTIKNKPEFDLLCKSFQLSQVDMIYVLIAIFPSLFNHHLIKFIKATYLEEKPKVWILNV